MTDIQYKTVGESEIEQFGNPEQFVYQNPKLKLELERNDELRQKMQRLQEKERRNTEKQRHAKNLGITDPNPGAFLFEILAEEYRKRNKTNMTNYETLYIFYKQIKSQYEQRQKRKQREESIRQQTLERIIVKRQEFDENNEEVTSRHKKRQQINKNQGDITSSEDEDENPKLMSLGQNQNQDNSLFFEQQERKKNHELLLEKIFKFKNKDVNHTLMIQKEKIEEEQLEQQRQEREAITNKIMTEQGFLQTKAYTQQDLGYTVDRLYGNPIEKKKKFASQKEIQRIEQKEIENEYKIQQKYEKEKRAEFVNLVMELYRAEYEGQTYYRLPDILFDYWRDCEDRESLQIEKDEQEAEQYFSLYFDDVAKSLIDLHTNFKGFESYDTFQLIHFWKSLSGDKIAENNLDFENEDNLIEVIDNYLEKLQLEEEQLEIQQQQQYEEELEKREKLKKKVLGNKEPKKTPLQKLIKPKERLTIGKELLKIKKVFPNDPIISRMINNEFKDTKIAKAPEEYDHADEQHEALVKNRQIVSSYSQVRGRSNSLNQDEYGEQYQENGQIQQIDKTDQMAEMFERQLEFFYDDKMTEIRKKQQIKTDTKIQENQMAKFMEHEAKDFMEYRKRRYEEKVPTLNQFLGDLYSEIYEAYPLATKSMFPYNKWGQSKQLKQKSYPRSLKVYFFDIVKSYVQDKQGIFRKDQQKKLAFWAPAGPTAKCRIHQKIQCPPGCNYQTLNQKIYKFSKEKKKGEDWKVRSNQNVWDNDDYANNKKIFLMTFDEIQNCTFQPQVGSRLPKKYKDLIRKTVYEHVVVDEKPGNVQEWVDKMGEDFTKRFPKIFKYGIYSRAKAEYLERKYHESYLTLEKAFDIEGIKQYFQKDKYQPPVEEHIMFRKNEQEQQQKKQQENQKFQKIGFLHAIVDKVNFKSEDFSNPSNVNFLNDVYDLIIKIEKVELELIKDKNKIENELNYIQQLKQQQIELPEKIEPDHPNMYNTLRLITKNQMCPLGDKCPGKIQGRWPESNIRSTVPIGVSCNFVHNINEIQLQTTIDNREKQLEDRINKIYKTMTEGFNLNSWKPGNNPIQQKCNLTGNSTSTGCKCAFCLKRKTNLIKFQQFKEKAKQSYQKNQNLQQKAQQKSQISWEKYQNINQKVGLYSKANKLFKKERYVEAFDIISKVIVLTKNILEDQKQMSQQNKLTLKQQLNLNIQNIEDQDQFLREYNKILTGKTDSEDPHILQKMKQYGLKTGFLGQPKQDVDGFLNNQIQDLYYEIEKKLQDQPKTIQIMENTINKYEKQNQLQRQTQQNSKNRQNQQQQILQNTQQFCPIYKKILNNDPKSKQKDCGNIKCNYLHKKLAVKGLKNEFCPYMQEYLQNKIDKETIDPVLLKNRICKNKDCPYAHEPYELDILSNDEKIQRIENSVQHLKQTLGTTYAPRPFKPSSSAQTRKDVEEVHNLWETQQKEQGNPQKHKGFSKQVSALKQEIQDLTYNEQKAIIQDIKKDQKNQNNIYQKDYEEILTDPHEKYLSKYH